MFPVLLFLVYFGFAISVYGQFNSKSAKDDNASEVDSDDVLSSLTLPSLPTSEAKAKKIYARANQLFDPLQADNEEHVRDLIEKARKTWCETFKLDSSKAVRVKALKKWIHEKDSPVYNLACISGLKIKRDDFNELIVTVIDLMDVDDSGEITFDEMAIGGLTLSALVALPHKQFQSEEERFDYVFKLMDIDGSGFLEETEIYAFVNIVHKLGGMLPEEKKAWRPPTTERTMKQIMRDCDENNDGKISRQEFTKLGRRLNLRGVIEEMQHGRKNEFSRLFHLFGLK